MNRKKYLYTVFAICLSLLFTMQLKAQDNVGIGTVTPDPSAILDLSTNNKGLLAPRLTAVQRLSIANPKDGLLVYDKDSLCFFFYKIPPLPQQPVWVSLCSCNWCGSGPLGPTGATGATGTTGATGPTGAFGQMGATGATGATGTPGLNGATGATGADGALNAWSLTGNAGTTAGTNFIGTTDNISFDFRTNNLIRGRITNTGVLTWGGVNTINTTDLTSINSSSTFPFAINGYSNYNGSGVYGSIMTGDTTHYGALQGEYFGTNELGAAVRGIDINDTAYAINGISGTQGWAGWFDGDAMVLGLFYSPSDNILKKNIKPLSGSIDKLMKLNIIEFDYNREEYPNYSLSNKHQYGVLAQEFEIIFPEFTKIGTLHSNNLNKGNNKKIDALKIKTISYVSLIPVIINALQEQQDIILKQQVIIDEQNKKLELIEQKITK